MPARAIIFVCFTILITAALADDSLDAAREIPHIEKGQGGEAQTGTAQKQKLSIPVTIVETPEQAKSAAKREQNAAEHEKADLDAQVRSANAAERAAATAERQEVPAWVQIILAIFSTIIATIAFVFSIYSARRSDWVSRQQLRAYVNLAEIKPTWSSQNGDQTTHVSFTVVFKNNGQTPARRIKIFRNAISIDRDTYGRDLVVTEQRGPDPQITAEIGVGVPINAEDFVFSIDEILENTQDGGKIIVYAKASYDDIFGERHITAICADIIMLNIPKTKTEFESAKENFGLRFTFYPKHNYSD